jgi:hypothetical protein
MLGSLDLGFDQPSAWVIGELEAELAEDLGLVIGVSVDQDAGDVGELLDDGVDLLLGHAPGWLGRACGEGVVGLFSFGFGDPGGDRGGVRSGVQDGAVLSQLPVAFGDLAADVIVGGWSGSALSWPPLRIERVGDRQRDRRLDQLPGSGERDRAELHLVLMIRASCN